MANPTMTLIGNPYVVGSGGVSSVTFGAGETLPQNFTDLRIVITAAVTSGGGNWAGGNLTINSSTSSQSFSRAIMYGSSTTLSDHASGGWGVANGSTTASNIFGLSEFYFPSYTAGTGKTAVASYTTENNSSSILQGFTGLAWAVNSPITSIKIDFTYTIAQYSTFYIYGIKNS